MNLRYQLKTLSGRNPKADHYGTGPRSSPLACKAPSCATRVELAFNPASCISDAATNQRRRDPLPPFLMRTLHCRAANTAEPRMGCRHISSDGESHSNALLALPTRWSVRYLTTEGMAKPHSALPRAWAGVVNRGRRAQDPGFRGLGEGFPRSFDVVMLADVLYYVPWGGPNALVPAPLRAPAALLLRLCTGEPPDVRP